MNTSKNVRYLAIFQAVAYSIAAVWALVDINSFMAVTGMKTDIWLVKTVALLLLATSAVLVTAVYYKEITMPVAVLALSNAAVLASVDIYYTMNDTISRIYLLDAGMEVVFLVAWGVVLWTYHANTFRLDERDTRLTPDSRYKTVEQ